ncbi:MAG: elongation factor 4 [Rickettsia sp.]|nr:elongation factor 4 [Rickettsia sp.]
MQNNCSHHSLIRNFALIAHIDHGKSTVADRLIEFCGGLEAREMKNQILDSMDIEQERGITIKAQTVKLEYKANDGLTYILNLIDTPGHVDFSYEVSRSLASCEGSILIVDGSQGVQAQTIANAYQAINNNHEILVAINKSDLPACDVERVKNEVENVVGVDASNAILISAKNALGIRELLEGVVKFLPSPIVDDDNLLQALLIDSWYDKYLGIVILVRIFKGSLAKNQKIQFCSTNVVYQVDRVGIFTPKKKFIDVLESGAIGFCTASIKNIKECNVGDTIIGENSTQNALSGFAHKNSVVFSSFYTSESSDFTVFKTALEKLQLNDSSLQYEIENSALGLGFRCGFLGLLHLEVVQQRLEREFSLDIISTSPSVVYKILLKSGKEIEIHNPSDFPELSDIKSVKEPWVKTSIIIPEDYLGSILELCTVKRGEQLEMNYISKQQVMLIYLMPLNEIVFNFYDKLKSCSKGYASFDWEMDEYRLTNLSKVDILINGEIENTLSMLVFKSQAEYKARELCKCLKNLIPKRLFQISIQATVGNKVIARENVKAFRKDVTAKCYGGDVTRKNKLLKKQKAGKKQMSDKVKITIPKSVFIEAIKI